MKKLFILILTLIITIAGVFLFLHVDEFFVEPPAIEEDSAMEEESQLWGVILDQKTLYF